MSIVASQTPELSGGHEGNNVAGCALSPPGVATTLGSTLSGWSPPQPSNYAGNHGLRAAPFSQE